MFLKLGSQNAAQFTKSLQNVDDYIQIKYNNEVGDIVRTLMKLSVKYPTMPVGKKSIDKEWNEFKERPNDMEVFMEGDWKIANNLEKEFVKYQKTAYPLVIGQFSPALRAQLEGRKGYETVNSNQEVVEVLKLIRGLCCKHNQNNDETYAVIASLKGLFHFNQKSDITNNEYLKEING